MLMVVKSLKLLNLEKVFSRFFVCLVKCIFHMVYTLLQM